MLRGALAARLVSEAGWRAYPEHGQVRLDRPLFVTGLPRTGTTALHRLLTADPAHQGLELWLAEAPQPRPPRDSWEANPVFRYIQAGCERHHVEHPEFMGVHYMAANQVEECWQLLRQSMRSISWECLAHLPSYSAWLRGQDWTPGVPAAPAQPAADRSWRRAPLGAEEPQPPVRAGRAAGGVPGRADRADPPRPRGGDRLGLQPGRAGHGGLVGHVRRPGDRRGTSWSCGRPGSSGSAPSAPGTTRAQFFDVSYDDLVADPVGTAEAVYAHFGLPFSGAAADAMRSLAGGGRSGPSHRYALADFGLTPAEVAERFGPAIITG